MSRGESLPPIDVFQVGEYYYVEDGHHRVSIAKRLKQEFIDAYVTQYFFWTYEDYFHEKLGLPDVVCSRPSYYKRLLDDIRELRSRRYGETYVDFREVAHEWHRDVFLPAISKIADCGLRGLGRKSTADHYCRYLRLRCTPRFRDKSLDEVVAYLVRRYTSPMYALDRVAAAILRGVVTLSKRLLKHGPVNEVNPNA
jgi:hypothetical protein